MEKLDKELLEAMQSLGLRDVLTDHANALHERATNAARAWEVWLESPAFLRRDAAPEHEARLDAVRRECQRELDAFARNPFAWLPLALHFVRDGSGQVVVGAFIGLELAHA